MYKETSGSLVFHAVRGREGKNDFWFPFAIVESSCGEGNIYSGKITLTSAGPLRENQQKPKGGREEIPQGQSSSQTHRKS